MDLQTHIQNTITNTRRYLSATMQDVTQEQFNWLPPGLTNPISCTYFHIASAEDFFVNRVIKGGAVAFMSDGWAQKTGVDQIPGPRGGWDQFRAKQFELAPIHEYVLHVQSLVDAYVATLTPEELAREVVAMGKPSTVASIFNSMTVHTAFHTGEIALMKGLQGAKGIPF